LEMKDLLLKARLAEFVIHDKLILINKALGRAAPLMMSDAFVEIPLVLWCRTEDADGSYFYECTTLLRSAKALPMDWS